MPDHAVVNDINALRDERVALNQQISVLSDAIDALKAKRSEQQQQHHLLAPQNNPAAMGNLLQEMLATGVSLENNLQQLVSAKTRLIDVEMALLTPAQLAALNAMWAQQGASG
jgi:hypothetical protein